jgi:hypothetical protein
MQSEVDNTLSAFRNPDTVAQICGSVGMQNPTSQEQLDVLLGTFHTAAKTNTM